MLLLLSSLAGCGGESSDTGKTDDLPHGDSAPEVIDDTGAPDDTAGDTGATDTTDSHDPDEEAELAEYTAFYDATVLQRVDLTLDDAAIAALQADPDTYVTGGLDVSGTHLDEVGVRLRGSGTWDEKPGFRLKLNEFVAGQRYAGVERVVLDAMTDDPAQGRIVLAAKLWADAGILAPRVSYAQVYVNGELFGLYANIEAIDDHFLAHHYAGDDGGDLWEAGDSADLTGYGVDHFDLVSGDGDEQSLEAARRAVWSDDDFYAAADARIDMAQFLDVWAWSIVVGSADSYPYDLNDYDLYDDPADDRYDFAVPTFAGAWDSGMQWDSTRGALGYRCLADETCRAELLTHATTAFTAFDGLDSVTVASDLFTLTDTAIVDDPRRASTTTEVTTARTTLTSRLSSWPERVRGEMGI